LSKKNFVIDTNVILYSPNCLETFDDNNVYIPAVVLEELDKLKSSYDMKGYHAREFIRKLENLRESGNLLNGVPLQKGGTLYVKFYNNHNHLPDDFATSKNDNFILGVALDIKIILPMKLYLFQGCKLKNKSRYNGSKIWGLLSWQKQ